MDSQLRFSIPAPHGAAGLNNEHIPGIPAVNGLNAYVPNYRIKRPKAEEPHLFTDEQLSLFFKNY